MSAKTAKIPQKPGNEISSFKKLLDNLHVLGPIQTHNTNTRTSESHARPKIRNALMICVNYKLGWAFLTTARHDTGNAKTG